MRKHFHRVTTGSRAPDRRKGPGAWRASRPRSPVRRTSGSRATAAAPTRRGTPGRCPPILRASRARCRSTTPPRVPGGCWRSTSTRAAPRRCRCPRQTSSAPGRRARPAARAPRRPVRRRRLAERRPPRLRPVRRAAAVARAARRRPRPVAALPRDRPGADVHPRRPDLALPAPATRAAAGGCSRCRWRTPGRPWSTRTGRRYGPRCWTSSRPSCSQVENRAATRSFRIRVLRPSWTTPASRGCPASAAAPRSALSLSTSPAPDGGTGHATRAAARHVWPSWARPQPEAGGWPRCESAIACGAWKGLAALYERRSEPGRLERLLPFEWRKCVGGISREENVRQWHTSDLSTRPPADESAAWQRSTD